MTTSPVLEHRVPDSARGERLDRHLSAAFPELSRARVQALIDDGRVKVDDRAPRPAKRLAGGERVRIELPEPEPVELKPEPMALAVLYEDRDVVVLDKPPGLVVHPGAGHARGTLVHGLLHHVKDLAGVGGEKRPGIVHRLDKETSGCLVVAKNDHALQELQKAFQSRAVEKIYLALVHGSPPEQAALRTLFGRHPVHRQRFTSKVKAGKEAVTRYRVVERFDGAALVEVRLLTGRTHQIRVHLSESGFPLLGDALYGGKRRKAPARVKEAQEALGRVGLHAWKLAFEHPRTGRRLSFEAPVPSDFARALELLRRA